MNYRKFPLYLLLALLLGEGSNGALAQDPFGSFRGAPIREAGAPSATTAREALDTVSRFVELRSTTNPHGYEKDFDFMSRFSSIRGNIQSLLVNSGPSATLSSSEIIETVTSALWQYEENHDDFLAFYHENIRPSLPAPGERQLTDTKLASMPPVDIAANILSLYLFVQAKDPLLADRMKKGSYIWPFCRTLNHGGSGNNSGVSTKQLLLQVDTLMKDNYSVSFLTEFVRHAKLTNAFTSEDLARWKLRGVPLEVITAALNK
jgi:hypothetical protein